MKKEFTKSELTRFAKDCVIVKSDIAKEIMNGNNDVLLEISKRFSKYAKENMNIDLDNGDVQNTQNILNVILECCDEMVED